MWFAQGYTGLPEGLLLFPFYCVWYTYQSQPKNSFLVAEVPDEDTNEDTRM